MPDGAARVEPATCRTASHDPMLALVDDNTAAARPGLVDALRRAGLAVYVATAGSRVSLDGLAAHDAFVAACCDSVLADQAARLPERARLFALPATLAPADVGARLAAFREGRTTPTPTPLLRIDAAELPRPRYALAVRAGLAATLADARADAARRATRAGQIASFARAAAGAAGALRGGAAAAAPIALSLGDSPEARDVVSADVSADLEGLQVRAIDARSDLATRLAGAARPVPARSLTLQAAAFLIDGDWLRLPGGARLAIRPGRAVIVER